jgi:hypothetical protein
MDLKQLHFDVIGGKSDYIPLVINTAPAQEDFKDYQYEKMPTLWDNMHNPQWYIDTCIYNHKQNMKLKTDRELVIESNFLESLIPSMFGAEMYQSAGGYIDVKPIISDIEEAEGLVVSDGQFDMALEHLKFLKNNTPEDFKVAITRFMAPLDVAVVMRGGDFYLDLLIETEKSIDFLNKITDVTLKTLKRFKAEIGESYREQVTTARGIYSQGTRLTGDAIVNVSPDIIKNILNPVYKRFKDELGGVMLHYCCLPAPSGHVLPTLAECDSIICVDNWQGYQSYFNKEQYGLLQDKVSMCFDLSIEEVENVEKLMENPLFRDVKRKSGRGLIVMAHSNDIEHSKKVYDNWRNYFERNNLK